jgi:uncharacterized protein (TIGR03083 family)
VRTIGTYIDSRIKKPGAERTALPVGQISESVSKMSANNPHDLYATERAALIRQLRSLTPDQAQTIVPACPDWTVKDVASHLSGLVAETLANVPPPRGSAEATTRQVTDRTNHTLAEVCDEWEHNGPAFAKYAASDTAFTNALLADLTVHAHDTSEALHLPIDEMSAGTIVAAERYLQLLQQRAAEQLDIALAVELTGVGLQVAPHGNNPLNLIASPFAFLRSVTGRRTPEEVKALNWTGDPSELIATSFYQYGPIA